MNLYVSPFTSTKRKTTRNSKNRNESNFENKTKTCTNLIHNNTLIINLMCRGCGVLPLALHQSPEDTWLMLTQLCSYTLKVLIQHNLIKRQKWKSIRLGLILMFDSRSSLSNIYVTFFFLFSCLQII